MKASSKPRHSLPTLAHVARLAGVGLGTASRAISGQGYVSEGTATRIRDAAERLGYQRNEVARNLKMKRSGAIGLVVPDIGGPFMVSCVRAIQTVLRQAEYTSIMVFTDGNETVEAEEIDYLIRHQIEGLIIVPARSSAAHLRSPRLSHIPVVAFDQPVLDQNYDAILVKNRHGARMAAQHLIEHGHKRVACLGVNRHLYSIQKRIEGYRDAIKRANLPEILEIVDPDAGGIGKQLDRWFAMKTPPTAIFGINELTSLEIVKALSIRKIRMPDQVAFVGFDDIQLGPYLDPPLTVVLQPAAEIGESVATRLLTRIETRDPVFSKPILMDIELVIRGSCGCACTSGQRITT
jgi:LacI family transcriptional regulator